jgi:hypothetical protein
VRRDVSRPPQREPVHIEDLVLRSANSCRAGEKHGFVSDGRPVRDLDQPTGGFTLPRMPVQRSRDPMRITTVERAAASAALGCPPWELGLCAGCGQLTRRYGRNAALYCTICRAAPNGR